MRILFESIIGTALASTLLKPLCPVSYYGIEPHKTTRTFLARDFYIAVTGFFTGFLVIILLIDFNLKPMALSFGFLFQFIMAFSIFETWNSFRFSPLLSGFVFFAQPHKQTYKQGEETNLHLNLKSSKNEIKPFSLILTNQFQPANRENHKTTSNSGKSESIIISEETVPPASEKEFVFTIKAGENINMEEKVFVKTTVKLLLTGKSGKKTGVRIGDFSFLLEKQDAEA